MPKDDQHARTAAEAVARKQYPEEDIVRVTKRPRDIWVMNANGSDRVDLCIGQRSIVLVLADADALVEVPGRHLAQEHALPDRLGPRPRVLIRQKRHRRRRARVMARLARLLEDRRHVPGERHVLRSICRQRGERRHQQSGDSRQHHRPQGTRPHRLSLGVVHRNLLGTVRQLGRRQFSSPPGAGQFSQVSRTPPTAGVSADPRSPLR